MDDKLLIAISDKDFDEREYRSSNQLSPKEYGKRLLELVAKEYVEFAGEETRLTAKGWKYYESLMDRAGDKLQNEIYQKINEDKIDLIKKEDLVWLIQKLDRELKNALQRKK